MHQLPPVADLLEVIDESAEVDLPTDHAEPTIAAAGLHHGQRRLALSDIGTGVLDRQQVVAADLALDHQFVAFARSEVGTEAKRALAAKGV